MSTWYRRLWTNYRFQDNFNCKGRISVYCGSTVVDVHKSQGSSLNRNCNLSRRKLELSLSGAIIRDRDRKRAPFLVLGLAPWYGTIFLFLKQIAPSPAAHARTCCEDFFADVARENWHPKFPKSFMLLAHNSTPLWLLEFCLSVFAVSCSSFISLTKLSSAAPFTRTAHYSKLNTKFHIWRRLTAFPHNTEKTTSWICLVIAAFRPNTWQ